MVRNRKVWGVLGLFLVLAEFVAVTIVKLP